MALPAPTTRERLLTLEAELDALAQAAKELTEEEHATDDAEAELMRSLGHQRATDRARAIALARRTSLERVERNRISALPSEISLLLFSITFKPLLPSTTLIHSNPSASDAQDPTKLLRSTHIASIFSLRLGKLAPLPSPFPLSSHPAPSAQGIDLSPDRDLTQAGRGLQGRSIGQVPVHELNAALGQLAFGLVCLGRRCGLPWRHLYRIEPHASQSIIHKYNPPHWEAHELHVAPTLTPLSLLHYRRFDNALVCILHCLLLVQSHLARSAPFAFPFQISKDRIGNLSIRLSQFQTTEEQWTRACSLLLANFQYLLAFVVDQAS